MSSHAPVSGSAQKVPSGQQVAPQTRAFGQQTPPAQVVVEPQQVPAWPAAPTQGGRPSEQAPPQTPPAQVAVPLAGAGQARPQVPQLAGSVARLRQASAPGQTLRPLGQTHDPSWQVALLGQALPQPPQLARSDRVSTQAPPQPAGGPIGQPQALSRQARPAGQSASVPQHGSRQAEVVVSLSPQERQGAPGQAAVHSASLRQGTWPSGPKYPW